MLEAQPSSEELMTLTSPSFANGAYLPSTCAYEAENQSPILAWTEVPAGAASLALICEDIDPSDTLPWTHWLLWNIPPNETMLPSGVSAYEHFPNGMDQGYNDFPELGWGGPCPPLGLHQYSFVLYALDCCIQPASRTRADFLAALEGHVMATASLTGFYESENILVSYQRARRGQALQL